MAEFLTTTATNYHLEELIKNAQQYLVLISPYVKVNNRLRELLVDRARRGLDIRIVYGKKHQPKEIAWLQELASVQVKFCPNLHAKCYLNEFNCIITSLNLYDFSQVNNNEMGVLISQATDAELFMSAFQEAKRLLRISSSVTAPEPDSVEMPVGERPKTDNSDGKLSTSRLAKKLGLTTGAFEAYLVEAGFLGGQAGDLELTTEGRRIGGERRRSARFGTYFLWPDDAFEMPR